MSTGYDRSSWEEVVRMHETVRDLRRDLYEGRIDARTYLAGQALAGILGASDDTGTPLAGPAKAAQDAVEYADAVIAELAKPRSGAAP